MTSTQFDQALKDYFKTIGPSLQTQSISPSPGMANSAVSQFPLPAENIGTSFQQVSEIDARALVSELMARLPEHRQQALQELNTMIAQPKMENAIEHRALPWMHMQNKKNNAPTE